MTVEIITEKQKVTIEIPNKGSKRSVNNNTLQNTESAGGNLSVSNTD